MATASSSDQLEDVFQEVAEQFTDIGQFKMFARSKHGLCLDYYEISKISYWCRDSVDEQRMNMLLKWKEKIGDKATAFEIRCRVEAYRKILDQLEDMFQVVDEQFTDIGQFIMFARSRHGLCLGYYEVLNTSYWYGYSDDEKRMNVLWKWKEKLGDKATAFEIRCRVEAYRKILDQLEDMFQEVAKQFTDIGQFELFAQSRHGLCLEYNEVISISYLHRDSVDEQRMNMLWKWKEKIGDKATAFEIRGRLEAYRKILDQLEDVFQEVAKQFTDIGQFKMFARSKHGLCLDYNEVGKISYWCRDSVDQQRMNMLWKWRKKLGDTATAFEIRCRVEAYNKRIRLVQLEDVFREEILDAFPDTKQFKMFAQSENGLCLSESDIQNDVENKKNAVDQKMEMLRLWRRKKGNEATVARIRYLLEKYQKGDNLTIRFEDVFQEVTDAFPNITQFKMFARSRNGLCLDEFRFMNAVKNKSSLTDVKMEMLLRWHEIKGRQAIVTKIRDLVERYQKKDNSNIRFEDVFQEVIDAFPGLTDFKMFAQSRNGLCLTDSDIQNIVEDNESLYDMEMKMLARWREINGKEATVAWIRYLIEKYQKEDYTKIQFEDVLEEVIDAFPDLTHFKMFARSRDGLYLTDSDIENIAEDNESLYDMKMKMLARWREMNGQMATISRIRYLVERYQKANDPNIRLVDVFQEEAIIAFPGLLHFKMFARSEDGLHLTNSDIQKIVEDNESLYDVKMAMLFKWRRRKGNGATVAEIRYLVERYQKKEDYTKIQLQDVFLNEVADAFKSITLFKMFARSRNGLCLSENDVQLLTTMKTIDEDKESFYDIKMRMLNKWREINGNEATVARIRYLVQRYQEEDYTKIRFEDVLREVKEAFPGFADFKMFAQSRNGLHLSQSKIEDIIEDNESLYDMEMKMLAQWCLRNGKDLTIERICCLVERYEKWKFQACTRFSEAHGLSEEYRFYADLQISPYSLVFEGVQSLNAGARDVAIKLIKNNDSNMLEAKPLLELDFHPNIVPILHFGIYSPRISSYIYIAMEKCRENLKNYMERLRRFKISLTEDQKLAIAKQFLCGLKFIHLNGIINGNIKLENVLISNSGNYIKICSFGFKRSLHQNSSNHNGKSEDTGGNCAPETYSNNVLSKEADVFSAGLLVYSIVSDGRHAYGDDPDRWISNIRDNINRDLSNISITGEQAMEGLLNHMLEHIPENRQPIEMILESNIFRKATTDLYLPKKVSRLANLQTFENKEERLEDEFQESIIPAFAKIEDFRKFARSKRGLRLDEEDIQSLAEDHIDSVESQKMHILGQWSEKMGSEATVQKIRSILAEYQKHKPEHERIMDIFQDEVIPCFAKITEFLKFARSRRGLCLDQSDIQPILEDHKSSVDDQKFQILNRWKEYNGSEATVQKIRSILAEYQRPKSEYGRLIDIFQDEVIPSFARTTNFLTFARSERGLCLDEPDIQPILDDNQDDAGEQKFQILCRWKQRNGPEATAQKIQSLLREYQKPKPDHEEVAEATQSSSGGEFQNPESEQLEQLKRVFEEVTEQYTAMEELKGFAKSKSGLGLPDNGFQRITSFKGQKSQMLEVWIEMLGSDATVQKLRSSAERYAAEKDFIHLPKGSFGMYKDEILRDQCYVYLGAEKSVSGDQQCAVKLLRHKKDKDEAEMLVKLERHENVVKVLHVGEYHGGLSLTTFVVMELCSTQHLGDIIKKKKFEESTALSWARQIVRALAFIHENNIVHLDIKPQNILFTQDQKSIKLADFDSSKKIKHESVFVQNLSDEGSEGYRAPEMYIHDKINLKVDIFAAGVTLAEVFSHGKHPFGPDRFLWTSNIKRNEGLDLSHTLIADKASANTLLMRMLDPRQEKRPTASTVLAEAIFQK